MCVVTGTDTDAYSNRHLSTSRVHPSLCAGKEIEIDIEPTDSIERIKERIEEKEGAPPVQQRWAVLSLPLFRGLGGKGG